MKTSFIYLALSVCLALANVSCDKPKPPTPQPQQEAKPVAANTATVDMSFLETQVKTSLQNAFSTDPTLSKTKTEVKNVKLVQIRNNEFKAEALMQLGAITTNLYFLLTYDGNHNLKMRVLDPATGQPLINDATQQQQENDAKREYTDFYNANVLFNQHDYKNAAAAYGAFTRNYPSSTRIPIVEQRMADIQRALSDQIDASNRAMSEKLSEIHSNDVKLGVRNGRGIFNYPGAVIVKGYGKTETEAFVSANKQLPKGADIMSVEYYSVAIGKQCCELSYKP